jgi:hypothetical protein
MHHPEDRLLGAAARLNVPGRLKPRLVGSFRAHGLTVPVWDLPSWEPQNMPRSQPPSSLSALPVALLSDAPLTAGKRRVRRTHLAKRQVSLS